MGGPVLALTLCLAGCAGGDAFPAESSDPVGFEQEAVASAPPERQDGVTRGPQQVASRWWFGPAVRDPAARGEPRLAEAVAVLREYFGSDDAERMLDVSVGAANDYAIFMLAMQRLTGEHPLEQITVWRDFEVAAVDGRRLLVESVLTEDRATGSGLVHRSAFHGFWLEETDDGRLALASFRRNGHPIARLVLGGSRLPATSVDGSKAVLLAVLRAPTGSWWIAGRLEGVPRGEAITLPVEHTRLLAEGEAQARFTDIGDPGLDGARYFLLSFPDHAELAGGAVLEMTIRLRERDRRAQLDIPPFQDDEAGRSS